MNATQQKKMSGELQADLQALLDDELKRNRQLEVTLHGVEALKNDFEDQLNTARKERDEATLKADSLFRELVAHREKAHGNYWAWQGDNDDHLESLVCPVLISAHDLKEILKQRDEVQAKCAEMRGALGYLYLLAKNWCSESEKLSVDHALSTECGKGWKSPEEVAALESKCAEMREVLEMAKYAFDGCSLFKWKDELCAHPNSPKWLYHEIIEAVDESISADCGKGWVRVSEVEPTIEILKHLSSFKATWVNMTIDPEIERLTKLMEDK